MDEPWAAPSGGEPEPRAPGQGDPYAMPAPPPYGTPAMPPAGRGRGLLVVAGIVVGLLVLGSLGLGVAGFVLAGRTGSDSDRPPAGSTGPSVAATRVDPLDLHRGDCLLTEDLSERIDDVAVVPCTQQHDAEMSGTVTLPEAPWPGEDEVDEQSDDACRPVFEAYVGIPFDDSDLDYTFITPRRETWESGDRLVICLVTTLDGTVSTPMAGSSA